MQGLVRAFFGHLVRIRLFTINASDFELHVLLGGKSHSALCLPSCAMAH